jgi:hypothetical protein
LSVIPFGEQSAAARVSPRVTALVEIPAITSTVVPVTLVLGVQEPSSRPWSALSSSHW